jgi:hypothetical protein
LLHILFCITYLFNKNLPFFKNLIKFNNLNINLSKILFKDLRQAYNHPTTDYYNVKIKLKNQNNLRKTFESFLK